MKLDEGTWRTIHEAERVVRLLRAGKLRTAPNKTREANLCTFLETMFPIAYTPTPLEKLVVIAGNHRQFQNWAYENRVNPNDAIYVSDEYRLRGYRIKPFQVIRYGTYYERPDIGVIEEVLKVCALP